MGLCCSDQVHGEIDVAHRRRGWLESSAGSTRSLSGHTLATVSISNSSMMSLGGSLRSLFGPSHVTVAPIAEVSIEEDAQYSSQASRDRLNSGGLVINTSRQEREGSIAEDDIAAHSEEDQTSRSMRGYPEDRQQPRSSPRDLRCSAGLAQTPLRERSMRSSVPSTPQGALALVYKYYCPLCMSHYEDVLTSHCCGNYCCLDCVVSYLNSRNIPVSNMESVLQSTSSLSLGAEAALACPNCGAEGFRPEPVPLGDAVRNYATTPGVGANAASKGQLTSGGTHHGLPMHSPIKVGDSFDDLKRKMQPFFSDGNANKADETPPRSGIDHGQHPTDASDGFLSPISEGVASVATPSTAQPMHGSSPMAIHSAQRSGARSSASLGDEQMQEGFEQPLSALEPRAIDAELAGVEETNFHSVEYAVL